LGIAVDTQHHLIVTHEVTNTGSDRSPKWRRRRRKFFTLTVSMSLPIAAISTAPRFWHASKLTSQ